jgi:GT2 family glycosyltransferase
VVYFGDASIMHRGNRSGARRYGNRREGAVFAGTLRYFRRHQGRGGELAFRAVAGTLFALKAALLGLRGLVPSGANAAVRARTYAHLAGLCLTGDPAATSDPPLPAPAGPATEMPVPDRPSSDGDSVVRPALSIVILSWNSRALLEDCLAALPAATGGLATEVIVVDNGSSDGTGEVLAADPSIVAVRNAYNRGVAPARNQGLRIARGEFLALLDVDTRPTPGSFAALVAYLRRTPHVGLVGPRLVGADGALQYSCRRFPTLVDKVLRRLPEHFGREIARDVEMRAWDHATPREVDYVIGACQVIRRTALAAVGLLDEGIFYGPEDVDLCLRMHRAGWSVDYVPEAEVMHLERRVTRRLFSSLTARHVHGLAHYFWKHGYLFTRPDVRTERRP